MTMKTKSMTVKVKSAGPDDGLEEGQFTAYASVFGNVDSYGDIVKKGAFKDTLEEWGAKDAPIPLLWGHDIFDMFNNIGHLEDAKEDDHGLLVKGQFDLENPNGAQAYKLVKTKRVTDLSFAYDVIEDGKSEIDQDGTKITVNELRKLKLHEVSVVPMGANSETEFVGVKAALHLMAKQKDSEEGGDATSDGLSSGKLTDVQLKALEALHESLGTFLGSLKSGDSDEKDDEAGGDAKSKSDERISNRVKLLDLF
jgi:HK97 family phage prohead protease